MWRGNYRQTIAYLRSGNLEDLPAETRDDLFDLTEKEFYKKYKKQIKVRGLGASAVIPSISGYGPTVSNEGVQQMQNALHELAKDPDAYAAWLQRTEESVDKWYSGQRKPNLAATQRLANVLGVINALPEGAPINEAQIAELQAAGREFSEHPYLDTAPEA